jgi:hypothetical protein
MTDLPAIGHLLRADGSIAPLSGTLAGCLAEDDEEQETELCRPSASFSARQAPARQ